jgi:nitrite reductase/ring-hydroxylating ferredoxin subunit
MPEHFVAKSAELREGERRIVTAGRHVIGVLRAKGRLHAFRNHCPHQGGPVCQGLMIHKVEAIIGPDKTYQGSRFNEDELHIVCPWHGWEFNIETGRCAGDGRVGLRRYEVVERNDEIYVLI